jgi:acetyl-CoA carboxylase biotin carboxyl carrier protein
VPGPNWLDEVREILERVSASDATELELEAPGFRLRVKRRRHDGGSARQAVPTPSGDGAEQAVVAPLTGVFYRAASPDARPYVVEGDPVQPDTAVGLIETMKVFNEVLAEQHGVVRRILVEPGKLVHAGDRLMLLGPVGEARSGLAAP